MFLGLKEGRGGSPSGPPRPGGTTGVGTLIGLGRGRMSHGSPLGRTPYVWDLDLGLRRWGDWHEFPVLGWIRSSPPRKWPHRWRCQLGHLTEADTPSPQNWGGGQSGTPWGRALNPRARMRSRPVGTCGDLPMETCFSFIFFFSLSHRPQITAPGKTPAQRGNP